jgi:hypothetical protein
MTDRMRIMCRGALLAALAALALPAASGAAEVTRPFVGQTSVTAARGEANRVRLSDDGPGFVRICDDLSLRESTSVCRPVTTLEVRCSVEPGEAIVVRQATGGTNVLFRGGTGVDTVSYADATARVRVGTGTGAGRTSDSDELAEVETIAGSRSATSSSARLRRRRSGPASATMPTASPALAVRTSCRTPTARSAWSSPSTPAVATTARQASATT